MIITLVSFFRISLEDDKSMNKALLGRPTLTLMYDSNSEGIFLEKTLIIVHQWLHLTAFHGTVRCQEASEVNFTRRLVPSPFF